MLPDHIRATAATHGMELNEPLPYSLDIWIDGINRPGRLGKVLSIEWDETRFVLTAFKRGAWEDRIIAADPGPAI